MAEKNQNYKDILGTYFGDDRVTSASSGARTEDEEKWLLQKALFGLDDDGRVSIKDVATLIDIILNSN